MVFVVVFLLRGLLAFVRRFLLDMVRRRVVVIGWLAARFAVLLVHAFLLGSSANSEPGAVSSGTRARQHRAMASVPAPQQCGDVARSLTRAVDARGWIVVRPPLVLGRLPMEKRHDATFDPDSGTGRARLARSHRVHTAQRRR